ncbi:hypothetical protein, conserved [Leishmania tarentolae]|uniref:Uncharacterized protein n=1 Tax=Leishmania tarentolae TaxID=5689 RepID=A0A640KB82_LEITA|nr:hypothetical protein, conserved [Leishmania tarentolae]
MVRVGAKRERPCLLILHIALRAAVPPKREGHTQHGHEGAGPSAPPREQLIWKTSATAEAYAKAVVHSIRAYWQLLGGVRYAGPDALTLVSAVWQDIDKAPLEGAAAARAGGSADGVSQPTSPLTSTIASRDMRPKQSQQRQQRMSATRRRSGVLRCAVHLSRSLYGDAGAVNLLRASCACVTEATVAVPMSQLVDDDHGAETAAADASGDNKRKRRRGRTEEDVGDVREQTCHAAVQVARVENVLPSRQRR